MPINATPDFQVLRVNDKNPLSKIFAKYTDVFGVMTYATDGVENSKLIHASTILAEYLDNNEDGLADNKDVVLSIINNHASMWMFKNQSEEQLLINEIDLEIDVDDTQEGLKYQNLYNEETHINGAMNGLFDASLEEVLHLISDYGYAKVFPSAFSVTSASELTNAMDVARGGKFQKVPNQYPAGAWYTYYDEGADYSTHATEYFYWGLTSYLGGQQFLGRKEAIQEEWALNTPELLKSKDLLMFDLITREEFGLPTKLPDGNYTIQKPHDDNPQTTSPNTDPKTVGRLYTAAFGRKPDEAGLQFWINVMNDPLVSYKDVSQDFVNSPEFSTIASPESSSNVFTSALYQNVLGRAPDASGLEYWTKQLDSGLQDRADVLMGFANSPENIALYEMFA